MSMMPPGNEESESFRQHNANWESDVSDNSQGNNSKWQDEGPRRWHEIFPDFLRMGSEDECAYLLNEPTANYGHAYRWYAIVNGVILAISVVLMLIFLPQLPEDTFENNTQTSPGFNNPNTTRQVEMSELAPENLMTFYCIFGPIGILANIIMLTVILLVVHTVATSAFQGNGDFEKLVYGVFTLNSAYSMAYFIAAIVLAPLIILLFLMSEALFLAAYCILAIVLFGVAFYILYLYTLVVKAAYRLGWGGAIASGIVAPFAAVIVLYCGCIFCFSATANT
ncbi:MAG: YIP1 family protein [Chloroflexi bacterium]|nr:YIP1 family protein [Chloroflexota bacterium]